jgi:DNA (cytosine-5)-methyltransferase 1
LAHSNLQHDQRRGQPCKPISVGRETRTELNGGRSNVAHANGAQCNRSCLSIGISSQNANISGYGSNAEVSDIASVRQSGQREYEQPFNSAEGCTRQTNNAESIRGSKFWEIEPNVGRVANGVASRVDRLKAIGNGQVSRVAATAFQLLSEGL